jgi:sterol desaturase/sphingolipid hydroxylase (fatty acid hydroxylase superfamily)
MSPGTSLLVLTALFLTVAALERVPRLRFAPYRLLRPYLATDAAWYGVATTAALLSSVVFRPQLQKLVIAAPANAIAALPWAGRLAAALLAYDLVAFAVHVGIHRWDVLWSVHKVHHSSLQLDWLATTRTHMVEHLLRNVPAQASLFVLGMPPSIVAATLTVYAAFALYGHSNLRVGPRWVEWLFVTPRLHRLHHLPDSTQRNYGTIFTVWDRLFGLLVSRDAAPWERPGVPGEMEAYPQRFAEAFRQPLREAQARRAKPANA